ncbi:unnamed protein product [Ixodes pacificus]
MEMRVGAKVSRTSTWRSAERSKELDNSDGELGGDTAGHMERAGTPPHSRLPKRARVCDCTAGLASGSPDRGGPRAHSKSSRGPRAQPWRRVLPILPPGRPQALGVRRVPAEHGAPRSACPVSGPLARVRSPVGPLVGLLTREGGPALSWGHRAPACLAACVSHGVAGEELFPEGEWGTAEGTRPARRDRSAPSSELDPGPLARGLGTRDTRTSLRPNALRSHSRHRLRPNRP